MKTVVTLLKPRIWSFKLKRFADGRKDALLKLSVFGTIGIIFWGGIFAVSLRVLGYFKGIEELGDVLAYKLLSMVLLTFLSVLIFSSILTSLSKLYLSRDLPLVHSMPVASYKIFIARWIESTIDSSWMLIVYTLPVFISYGIVYRAGMFFYGNIVLHPFAPCHDCVRSQCFACHARCNCHPGQPYQKHLCIPRTDFIYGAFFCVSLPAAGTSG